MHNYVLVRFCVSLFDYKKKVFLKFNISDSGFRKFRISLSFMILYSLKGHMYKCEYILLFFLGNLVQTFSNLKKKMK